jgi:TolB-like protein
MVVFFLMLAIVAPSHATELDQAVQRLADTLTIKNEAKVVQVKGDKLYLNIGKGRGVLPGHEFEIVRLGDPIVDGGETIGHEEQTIATVTVFRSMAKLTIAKVGETTEPPRVGDKAYQQRKNIARIVVVAPTYQGAITELGNEIQDKLINTLVYQGIGVVERSRLEAVLREQKVGYSGLVDLSSAKKVGKLLGADAIILGSIRDASNSVAVNLRLVDLESGIALAGASTELAKTPDIARGLEKKVGSRYSVRISQNDQSLVWEGDDIKIAILSLTREGSNLVLKVRVSNKKNKILKMLLDSVKEDTYLIDEKNNQVSFSESRFSNWTNLSSNANRIVTIVFDGKNAVGNKFEWVSRYACGGCKDYYFSSLVKGIGLK